jgi:hypothetical protein
MSTYLREGDHIADGAQHQLSYDWLICHECMGPVFLLKCSCGDEREIHAPVAFTFEKF